MLMKTFVPSVGLAAASYYSPSRALVLFKVCPMIVFLFLVFFCLLTFTRGWTLNISCSTKSYAYYSSVYF